MTTSSDPMGMAIADYLEGKADKIISVDTNLTEDEELPVEYLFRKYEELPIQEKMAIDLAKGKCLDVGAGSGTHSIILKEKNVDVVPLDISKISVESMIKRGLDNAICNDFFLLDETQKYDTLYFLMNGIGLVQKLDGLPQFFEKCKKLLTPDGQILLDSSDIIYMFIDEEDGGAEIDLNAAYYGEMTYYLSYKDAVGEPFDWLYLGYELLEDEALNHGFTCEKICDGDHYDYLAKLTLTK